MGVVVAAEQGGSTAFAGALPVLLLLLAFSRLGRRAHRRGVVVWVALGLSGVSGAARTVTQHALDTGCVGSAAAGPATIAGTLLGRTDSGRSSVQVEGRPCDGQVVRVVWQAAPAPPGRRVELHGFWRPHSGDGHASFVVRQASLLERGSPLGPLRVRGWILERSVQLFGASAGVLDALLLARREGLGFDLTESFARAGVAHLLAISGFHVGVVATVLFLLTLPLPVRAARRPLYTAVGVLGYLALIGFPTAATRAGLFLMALACARATGRPVLTQAVMSGALLVLLWVRPELLFSVGLQLSFAGVLGLSISRGPIERALSDLPIPRGLLSPIATGLAASLWTAPLVGWHFGTVSWIGVLLSVILTPWVALIIVGGLGALALSVVSSPAGAALAGPTDWATQALVRTVAWVSDFPWVALEVSRPSLVAVMMGALLGARLSRGASATVRVLLVVALGASLPGLIPTLRDTGVRAGIELVALDVGKGDAIAIRTPRGRWMLVDTGGRTARWDAGRDRIVPYLKARGVRSLDLLLLSHADLDHTGGAASVIRALRPRQIVDPGVPVPSDPYRALLATARERGIPWVVGRAGQAFEVDGVRLVVLSPGWVDPTAGVNDQSLVLLVDFGRFEALLTGDVSAAIEEGLALPEHDRVEMLKVGHHGSRTSSGGAFLERLRPELAVISVGARNRYGHPDPGVLGRLVASGAYILRTDRDGDVRIRAEASGAWEVSVERGDAAGRAPAAR